jgi:hypothetical protein
MERFKRTGVFSKRHDAAAFFQPSDAEGNASGENPLSKFHHIYISFRFTLTR